MTNGWTRTPWKPYECTLGKILETICPKTGNSSGKKIVSGFFLEFLIHNSPCSVCILICLLLFHINIWLCHCISHSTRTVAGTSLIDSLCTLLQSEFCEEGLPKSTGMSRRRHSSFLRLDDDKGQRLSSGLVAQLAATFGVKRNHTDAPATKTGSRKEGSRRVHAKQYTQRGVTLLNPLYNSGWSIRQIEYRSLLYT